MLALSGQVFRRPAYRLADLEDAIRTVETCFITNMRLCNQLPVPVPVMCGVIIWACCEPPPQTGEALFPRALCHAPDSFLQLAPSFPSPSLLIPRFPPRRLFLPPRRTCPSRRHASPTLPDSMARKPKTASPSSDSATSALPAIEWKYTKSMNMQDLARDDDYLSHLFIEKIGSMGGTQMLVHRMDPRRRLPKTDAEPILAIIHRVCHPMFPSTPLTHRNSTRRNVANRCEALRTSSH